MPTSTGSRPTILVTGAAGTLGQSLLPLLLDHHAAIRTINRRGGIERPGLTCIKGDLNDPAALQRAMSDVDVVVHLASDAQHPGADLRMGRAVSAAAGAARVQHLVYMSIASLERMPGVAYYREKLAVERLVEESGVPYTFLRATQFHELVAQIIGRLTLGPLSLVPRGVTLQPVECRAVAQRLAELTRNAAAGRVQDVCGPEQMPFEQLAWIYHRAQGTRKQVLRVPLPLPLFQAWRRGAALSGQGEATGQSWQTWCDSARAATRVGAQPT